MTDLPFQAFSSPLRVPSEPGNLEKVGNLNKKFPSGEKWGILQKTTESGEKVGNFGTKKFFSNFLKSCRGTPMHLSSKSVVILLSLV